MKHFPLIKWHSSNFIQLICTQGFLVFIIFFPHLFTATAGASSYFFQILQFNVEQNIKCWIMKSGDSDIKRKMVSHMYN